jgi:hypothetical protein
VRRGPTPSRPPRIALELRVAGLLVGCLVHALLAAGCGGGAGGAGAGGTTPATVALRNETDLGMAPLVVEEFFLDPVGAPSSGNRLPSTVLPGGVVILGPFPPGLYNATAVLEGGTNVNWVDEELLPGEPKNFIVP